MERVPTVAVLYPGEMGAALARVLASRQVRVVTTLEQRSAHTARRCRETGLTVLESFGDVVREADVVLSLVSPAAAAEVAGNYCDLAHLAPPEALYVDVNSIRPELATSMAANVEACGRSFVDAAINGLSRNLTSSATLFLSGARAAEIERLFSDAVKVRLLGDEPGRASAMKMLLSGLSKGTCALFLELALLAQQRGMLAEMIEASGSIYPGIAQLISRMLPTYAKHAGRRAEEMGELDATARSSGLESSVIEAVGQLHEMLAEMQFERPPEAGGWTVESLVRHVAQARLPDPQPINVGGK